MVATPHVTRGPVALSDNARTVLARRYLLRDADGEVIETPAELLARVAEAIAAAEPTPALAATWAQRFYDEMAALRFLPNSPTLMNAGTAQGTLAACFVLPVEDTLESIMATAQAAAMVQKFGGGTGFSLSRLRGEDEPIASTHGRACGPISVLRHYDDVSRLVTQGGKRDGANMGVLRVDHPDIRAFIHAKDDGVTAQRFNISIGVTDEFMEAAANGEQWTLRDPRDGEPRGSEDARALLAEIADSAWRTGDPGLIFLDSINRTNPTPALGDLEATNPCGEVPLLPWEACTLGSINVVRFWDAGAGDLDWDALGDVVALATRFLDNVVEMNEFPLPEITVAVRGNRKIGLGIMGFADLLIAAGIPYDSEAALALADRLGREIAAAADATSAALGEEKGVFPNWEQSIYADGPRYRNATRTCIAPTGTIAIIAGASPGIEPLFSLAHQRRMGDGTLLTEASVAFEQAARDGGFHSQTLLDDLALGGSIEDHDQVPAEVRRRFATAHEIAPQWHARMQAAFQARTDLAVSKTVNLPHAATPDQISEVFQLTHELGCKGVTVYRDGSRAAQVLSHPSSEPTSGGSDAGPYTEPHRRHLPDERRAVTHKFRVGDQEGYLTVGLYDDGTPGELFMKMAKEGSTVSGLMDAVALLTSISLQYGVTLEKLADKLEQTRFEPYGSTGNPRVPLATSILDYVFRWLRLHFSDEVATTIAGGETVEGADDDPARPRSGLTCPDCGLMLDYAEGCLVCRTCGYTRCG
ncbi:MAG TPA: adenosylcobalamin-dependent ribonucleoside-diphosphate reductase [Dehalococcoidia bacterium]|jgi:ribonucleoside-diphosphate reductase alpha chain|nr:adenosylcobalamin-dependent ribonucleoside-diphosphate reductase [Dehalococcoidia bacterium]